MMNDRDAHRYYWALNFYHFVNDAINFMLPTLMRSFYREFSLNYTQTSLVFALNLAMIILGQLMNGYLMDQHHEKQLYYVGLGIMSGSTIILLYSTNFLSLLIFAMINGFGLSFLHPMIYGIGAKLYPTQRSEKMAIQGSMGDLGKLIGIISSSTILALNPNGWKIPIMIWGSLSIGLFLVASVYLKTVDFSSLKTENEEKIKDIGNQEKLKKNKDIYPPNRKRAIIVLLLIFMLYNGAAEIIVKPLTIFLQTMRMGFSNQYAEILLAAYLVTGTLGSFSSGKIRNKVGLRKFLAIIFLNCIIGFSLYIGFNIDNFILDGLFIMFFGFNLFSVYSPIQAELSHYFKFDRIGLGFGVILGIGWSGSFLSMTIIGPLADTYGPQIYFISSIIFSALILLVIPFIPQRITEKNGK